MAISPRPKLVYGWLEMPSAFSGASSAFDFLGLTRWWHKGRFRGDADNRALASDFTVMTNDLRRSYYKSLREAGVQPPQEVRSHSHEQIALFDTDAFSVGS